MDDTEVDFKEMTGAGLDTDDIVGIVEIDEEEVAVPEDEGIDSAAFGLNGRPQDTPEDPETLDDDYSDMEQLLMDANGWEER